MIRALSHVAFFLFNCTPTAEIYTLSLHDALPISAARARQGDRARRAGAHRLPGRPGHGHERAGPQFPDRKSTRLNSSHMSISYAVFCLKKKIRSQVYGRLLRRQTVMAKDRGGRWR